MRDYFTLLGVPETSTKEEVKRAYKKLAQVYHPDKGGNVEKFKQIKQAYDFIIKNWGTYKPTPNPQPKHDVHWYTTWSAPGYKVPDQPPNKEHKSFSLTISFGDLFGNSNVEIPGTGFYVKPPYAVTEGSTHRQVAKTLSGRDFCTVDIKYHIVDPLGFYYQKVVNGINSLCCKVNVTSGMVLSGFEFSLRNINPNLDGFAVKASTDSLLCIPHVGLPDNRQSRGNLYIEQIIELKPLDEEIYPVLLELQKRVKELLDDRSYSQHIK